MDKHNQLYDLLTRLGAVPGTIECYDDENFISAGTWEPVDDAIALAILCDKARRVCDEHNVDINAPEGNFGWHGVNGWEDSESGYDDYESALIAGLEWLDAQREAE